VISSPGARRLKNGALFEKLETKSRVPGCFPVEPTLMVEEIQAGVANPSLNPSFPDAAIEATPALLRRSMAIFSAGFSASQKRSYREPPRLRLTAARR
jgi:hypothetical protein